MVELVEGKEVEFDVGVGSHRGVIRGKAVIAQPIIGHMVIVEITDGSFPNDYYPFSCVSVSQHSLKEV